MITLFIIFILFALTMGCIISTKMTAYKDYRVTYHIYKEGDNYPHDEPFGICYTLQDAMDMVDEYTDEDTSLIIVKIEDDTEIY